MWSYIADRISRNSATESAIYSAPASFNSVRERKPQLTPTEWMSARCAVRISTAESNAWEIMKLLEEINQRGTTVIVVTHNLEIVKVMKKRVITIKKGVVVSDNKRGGYSHAY